MQRTIADHVMDAMDLVGDWRGPSLLKSGQNRANQAAEDIAELVIAICGRALDRSEGDVDLMFYIINEDVGRMTCPDPSK